MNFISFDFFLFTVLAIFLMRFTKQPHLKSAIVLFLNAIFFASFFASPIEALPVLGMLALGYVCLQIVARFRYALGFIIVAVILLFAC